MLLEPTPSPFDLRWRMFGVPVRVHFTFWLFMGILGFWTSDRFGFTYLLIWIACGFVSILVHEFGHVAVAALFGEKSQVLLHTFGGLALGNYHRLTWWQRVLLALGGPAAGFALFGLVVLFQTYLTDRIDPTVEMPMLRRALMFLWIQNLVWSIVNLIPIFPLDGGQVTREIFTLASPRNGFRFALGFSFLLAALLAVYLLIARARPELPLSAFAAPMNIVMVGLLAVENYMMMQQVEREQRRWENDENPW